jgi:cytidyltransferase-like protein
MIIYTGGTFDLFHKGHVNLLQWCRSIGEEVVVSLNTDEFIYSYKGKNPIVSFEERKEVLLACKYVDRVIPNYAGADSKPSILSIMPNIIVIIYDACLKMRKLGGGSSVRAVHGMDGMRIGNLPRTNQTSGAPTRSKAPNLSSIPCLDSIRHRHRIQAAAARA